jgi:pimeloyl-ACP methyl ester carboxylesterase
VTGQFRFTGGELLDFPGGELEVLDLPGEPDGHPLVLMHGGLGSVELWDRFPHALNAATGCRTVAFSRHGHGRSARPPKPRTPAFMHEEAREVLPEVLARLQLENPVLVGHSDGASIALIYAADHAVPGVVAIAPHVFVEQVCIDEIRRARERYENGDLREKMAPHHRDVDAAFFGWCDVWLDPAFRGWEIRELVKHVNAPMLLIQGVDDQYGTLAQLDEIERLAPGPVRRLHLDCRHAPFVQRLDETVEASARFVRVGVAVGRRAARGAATGLSRDS